MRLIASLAALGTLLGAICACSTGASSPSGGGAGAGTAGGGAGSVGGAGNAGGAATTLGGASNAGGAGATNGAGGAANGAGATNGGAANGGGGATNGGGAPNAGGGATNGGAANSAGAAAGGASGNTGSAGAAGSTGSGGNGGSAGAPTYNPCPTNGDACKVMPLGDSITDGCCGDNTISMNASYRLELFRLSLTHNKKLTFVGSHQSGPNTVNNVAFPKSQEGHSGWTIADGGGRDGLQKNIAGWLKATPADIVTLMIGTNDVDLSLDLPNAPKRLGTLLDTITTTSPKALVVLAQIVPSRKDDENMRDQTYNGAMPALVKTLTDAGKHVILVDMYGAYTKDPNFKTALLANDLHPTDAGYVVLANTWWAAIGDLLPAK
ncbi:MAG: SGNH/GDSL hydrolase family protein [Polyangiaceae bacterium]